MSTLKVDTLQSTGGAATTFTKQEGVKARLNYNDHTPATRESFNVSSINDEAAGKFKPTWTNNFGNANYSATISHAEDNGLYSNHGAGSMSNWYNSSRTTAVCYGSTSVDEDTFTDMRSVEGHFIGDLA